MPAAPDRRRVALAGLAVALAAAVPHAGALARGAPVAGLLLHPAVSLGVLALGLELGLGLVVASLGAVLFAVHPVHVEPVLHPAGPRTLLAAGLVVAAVIGHARALRAPRPGPLLAVPVALAGAALLAGGPAAAAVVPIALAHTLLVDREPWSRARTRVLALGTAHAAVLVLALAAGPAAEPVPWIENPLARAGAGTTLLSGTVVLGHGLGLLLFPRHLSPDWSYDAIPLARSALDPRFLGSAAAVAAALAAGWLARRSRPALAFLVVWYAAAALAASGLVRAQALFQERALYLPAVAFCLGAVALVKLAAERVEPGGRHAGWIVPAAGLLLLAVLQARALTYAAAWRDETSLLAEAVRAAPRSARARLRLGAAYLEAGRLEEGLAALDAGLALLSALPLDPPARAGWLELLEEARRGTPPDRAALEERLRTLQGP